MINEISIGFLLEPKKVLKGFFSQENGSSSFKNLLGKKYGEPSMVLGKTVKNVFSQEEMIFNS